MIFPSQTKAFRAILCGLIAHSSAVLSLRAAEVRFVAITKGSYWEQTSAAAPVQQAGNAFQYRAHAELARPNAISSASLAWPRPSTIVRQLTGQSNLWTFAERFASRAALNNAAPNGAYTFVIQSAIDGRRTNSVTVTSDIYPLAPRIANFAEAQAIDAKADFTLRWDPAGTGANGFTQVRILNGEQVVFQTPSYPQAAGALNGSAGAVMIPRNTLVEGSVYKGEITIWRKVDDDLTGYPGVAAWGAYTQTTEFLLRTQFAVTDTYWYGFARTRRYEQASANAPAAHPIEPFEFTAFANATAAANISAVSVSLAGGAAALVNSAGSWRIAETFATQQALDTRFPVGIHQLSMQTVHNGTRNLPLSLPAAAYPPPPQVSNFNEANAIDPAQPFVLRWNPMPGGTTADFLQIRLLKNGNPALQSGDHPFASGALNGTSTSFTLPANFLGAGESCEARIFYLKAGVLDTFSYPKVLGMAGYASLTSAPIRARSGNATPPLIQNARRSGSLLEFGLTAETGRQYIVQGSSDFTNWTTLLVTNAPGSNLQLRINIDPRQHRQLLRVMAH